MYLATWQSNLNTHLFPLEAWAHGFSPHRWLPRLYATDRWLLQFDQWPATKCCYIPPRQTGPTALLQFTDRHIVTSSQMTVVMLVMWFRRCSGLVAPFCQSPALLFWSDQMFHLTCTPSASVKLPLKICSKFLMLETKFINLINFVGVTCHLSPVSTLTTTNCSNIKIKKKH